MISIINDAVAASSSAGAEGSPLFSVLFFAFFLSMMYVMLIRPQRQKQKEHALLLDQLAIGDEVLTTGGIVGRITTLSGNFVQIRVAENTLLTLQKSAVVKIYPKGTLD